MKKQNHQHGKVESKKQKAKILGAETENIRLRTATARSVEKQKAEIPDGKKQTAEAKSKSENQKAKFFGKSELETEANGFERVRRMVEKDLRTRSAREKKLFDLFQGGKRLNAPQIAPLIPCSEKTVYRDVEHMRSRLGLPIEYDPHEKVYYFTKPVERFPGLEATAKELLALSVLCKAIALFAGADIEQPLKALFEKALSHLDEEEQEAVRFLERCILIRPYGVEAVAPETFETATTSLRKGRVMEGEYCKPEDTEFKLRRIEPYQLAEFLGRWYVIGYDHGAKDIRTFALSRMRNTRVVALKYKIPADFDPHKHFEKSLGIRTGKEQHEIVVELNRRGAGIQRGRQWHSSQTWKELPNGCAELSLRLSSLHEIEQTILGWGTDAIIKGPPPLRARFYEIGKFFVDVYGPAKTEKQKVEG